MKEKGRKKDLETWASVSYSYDDFRWYSMPATLRNRTFGVEFDALIGFSSGSNAHLKFEYNGFFGVI